MPKDSLNFRAAQEERVVGEGRAIVTDIGEVDHGGSDSVQERNVNDVDVGILTTIVSFHFLQSRAAKSEHTVAVE